MAFMASAHVSCASRLIEPKDMAPVEKRLTISPAGSTCSMGTGLPTELQLEQPADGRQAVLLIVDEARIFLVLVLRVATHRMLQVGNRLGAPDVASPRRRTAYSPPISSTLRWTASRRTRRDGRAPPPPRLQAGRNPRSWCGCRRNTSTKALLRPTATQKSGHRNRTGRSRCPSWT